MNDLLLDVENLNVVFKGAYQDHSAVRNVSFTVGRGKVAIVGESGSGKSQTCRALLKLTPKVGRISADKMRFGDVDLLNASEKQMRRIRGNRISMVFRTRNFPLTR